MTIAAAEMFWTGVAIYLGAGAVFAFFFIWRGVDMIDASAKGANILFRIAIFPGVVALWPLMLLRTMFGPKAERH